ncbi:MAG: DsbA family protein [Levilactobacillus sp.]|uniref:DsbA family protein n=1 Tax=Levilactobacillus suantsaiihabitans TaxID=2487722 RepID=A0A4Z0J7N9_9LACO|nr:MULTISPECIES: DsbA family protein [Levilactobacillus]MCH4123088.1 DsbA family protein [Levilactobacillus sp.]MCI1552774.1 DsbA family protein [Levilactobacillus sp.]MCI1598863.1 DsbA family protein [Levilactobacillus sp.]MCI1606524.1 DsbA family protein [Levilactobacillus sp.]TGD18066.1 DsbA family protein [Levilactobacillus suantsaiihabitans]
MLEVYLFVNPLGARCMRSERNIIRLADHLNSKVSFQFVPLLNQQTVAQSLAPHPTLAERNARFNVTYQAILAYKAALFQGKRKGRKFLLNMQDAVVSQHQTFSEQLTLEMAKKCQLDLDMFTEDCQSDLAKQAFQTDQKLAAEMKIEQSSSAVIFNCDVSDCGLLLNDVTYESLCDVCESQGVATKEMLMAEPNYQTNEQATSLMLANNQSNLHVL